MDRHNETGLGEAFASYQPKCMDAATWERYRHDAEVVVRLLPLRDDPELVAKYLSRLARFLADFPSARPEATVQELLTTAHVAGFLARLVADGTPSGTVLNLQGTLNALLAALAGQPVETGPRGPERHRLPYDRRMLAQAVAVASDDAGPDGLVFVAAVAHGLATGHLPTRTRPDTVDVDVDGRQVRLDVDAVERARRWGKKRGGVSLDVHRLRATRMVTLIEQEPAAEVLRLPDAGRDVVTAAAGAAARPDAATVRTLLRGSAAA